MLIANQIAAQSEQMRLCCQVSNVKKCEERFAFSLHFEVFV